MSELPTTPTSMPWGTRSGAWVTAHPPFSARNAADAHARTYVNIATPS